MEDVGAVVRELFNYEPETGAFIWKTAGKKRRVGYEAGCARKDGRWVIRFGGKLYLRSRLAFLWMTGDWPEHEIDHIDGDATNDRWGNLREATSAQQKHNRRRRSNNETGFKGVCWSKRDNSYGARICFNGEIIHLGTFKTAEAAHEAYANKARELCGEFFRAA